MGLFDGHRDGVTPTSTADVAKRLRRAGRPGARRLAPGRQRRRDRARLHDLRPGRARGRRDPQPLEPAALEGRPWRRRWSAPASRCSGYLPGRRATLELPSRHLGLVVADELSAEVERRDGPPRRRTSRSTSTSPGCWRSRAEAPALPAVAGGGRAGRRPTAPSRPPRPAHRRRLGRRLRLLLRRQPRAAARARRRARVLQPADGRRAARLRRALPRRRLPRAARRGALGQRARCAVRSPPPCRPACRPTPSAAACSTCASRSPTSTAAPGRWSAPSPAARPCTSACRAWATARRVLAGDSLLGPAGAVGARPRVPLLELRARERAPRRLPRRRLAGGLRRRRPLRLATSTCTSPGTRPCSSTGSSAAGPSPALHSSRRSVLMSTALIVLGHGSRNPGRHRAVPRPGRAAARAPRRARLPGLHGARRAEPGRRRRRGGRRRRRRDRRAALLPLRRQSTSAATSPRCWPGSPPSIRPSTFRFGRPLGADARVADILLERAEEATCLD